jgi:AcrR family transcriptional regulator
MADSIAFLGESEDGDEAEWERRTMSVDATRQAILDAAHDVFVAEGYDGASIRKVAQRAGYSHGTIYLHFRDKDDLLYQLSEEQFRALLERLRALPRSLDALSRLTAALRTYVDYGLEFPNHYDLMFSIRPAHLRHAAERRFGPMAEQVYAFLYDVLVKAGERGLVAIGDPDVDTTALIAAMHGAIEMYKADAIDLAEARAAAERLIVMLQAGLERRPVGHRASEASDSLD